MKVFKITKENGEVVEMTTVNGITVDDDIIVIDGCDVDWNYVQVVSRLSKLKSIRMELRNDDRR